MLSYFAATEPITDPASFYFTQGVLGVTVIVLALVIRFMFKYYTDKLDKKDLEIKALYEARYQDYNKHADDYRQMASNDQAVMSTISQAQELLAAKIEAAKAGN